MKADHPLPFFSCMLAVALLWPSGLRALSLNIGGNVSGNSYDPMTGVTYAEVRERLIAEFPETSFNSLPALLGDLSGFDLLILNRFSAQPLTPAEQANVHDYVMHGGNLLYVGEDTGLSNDSFTLPFGIVMTPDPSTDVPLAFASYTNPTSQFLSGPYGSPSSPPSGSDAAQIVTLGLSVELARWDGGGVAISGFERNTLGPGAGFGLFATDVNMMTPNRFSTEFAALLTNALVVPEPDSAISLLLGALACFGRQRCWRKE